MSAPVLFDLPGPATRRRLLLGSVLFALLAAAVAAVAVQRLADSGQLSAAKWGPVVNEPKLIPFLWEGLVNTAAAAALALVSSLAWGIALALGRLSQRRWVRLCSTFVVEFFRGVPVLLMMLFFFLGFPLVFGIDLTAF